MNDSEKNFALRQGHEIAAEDGYFDARPQIDSMERRKVFAAGFERGWEAALASAPAQPVAEPCVICGSQEPYTGTCGSSDPRALCKVVVAAPQSDTAYAARPLVITSAPERIWLDLGFDPREEDAHFSNLHDLTWSADNATGDGIEYVRADIRGHKP